MIVWLTWVTAWLAAVAGEQRFAMEPQDQTAVVGSRVTLPCRVTGKTGTIQWTKDGFGLGEHRELQGFERYSMIGSDDEGDYSLEIYPVSLDDDGEYQCQVSPGLDGEPGVRSRDAVLTVLMPPEPPRIVQGSSLQTTEDRLIELECVSLAGKPPAEITWIDGFGNVLRQEIEYIVEKLPDGKRFNAKSILRLTPKKEHHNTEFTCQAQNAADRTYRSAKIKLQVRYAPKVSVSIEGGPARLVEGVDVRFKCTADANPPDVNYRWFINDRLVEGDATTELVLTNVTRAQHDSIVKCEVHNAVGKSEESETLDITYGPKFRHKPMSIQAEPGQTVTLTCDVDGNPQPDIVWIHEATDRVVSTSMNYSVKVTSENSGRYYCKASVMGFPEIGAEATLFMKGPPSIVSHRSQFGVPGDTVRVECTAFAIPPPTKVIWSHRGEEITSASPAYTILEDSLSEGIKSSLVIRDSKPEDFGIYNCTVVNIYGSDSLDVSLKPQSTFQRKLLKSFPVFVILAGVIGGVVIIIFIILIIVLCQKNNKKPQVEQLEIEKQCKESDRSSNISDIKMDLRTGSSVSNVHCEVDYGGGGGSESGSEVTRVGVPLAGPVPLDRFTPTSRYSTADYTDPVFPPKSDGSNNNGYIPYCDYSRDYTPPPATGTACGAGACAGGDPRYSAAYGNPYLRTGAPNLPPPPPYTALRNGGMRNGGPPGAVRPPAPSPNSLYITSPTQTTKRPTLATHV